MTVNDKAVLVTGANRGLGQALAAEALARGAKRVYACPREPLAHPDDRVTPLRLNVTSAAQIQALARRRRQAARAPARTSGTRQLVGGRRGPSSSSTGMVRTPAVWRAYSAKPG